MTTRAEHLVIDTGGFIKNDMGSLHSMADNLVTLQEVILYKISCLKYSVVSSGKKAMQVFPNCVFVMMISSLTLILSSSCEITATNIDTLALRYVCL